MMLRILRIFCVGCCFLQFIGCQAQEKQTIQKMNKAEFAESVVGKNVQLIDVRTPSEYQLGHIDGALNFNVLDKTKFVQQISNLNETEPVYLYCKKGGRSNKAATLMKSLGFQKIYDFSGGYNEWSKKN